MCHYITGILPPQADTAAVERIAQAHGRRWEVMEKHSLQRVLRDGETYALTTAGHCDCGTGLGMLARHARQQPDYSRRVKKLRKQGWSEARIERWLDEKRKRELDLAAYLTTPPNDVLTWCEFVREVLNSGAAKYVGLLLHWYSGLIETEPSSVRDRRWIPLDDLNHECLLRADEDVIHTFCIRRGAAPL